MPQPTPLQQSFLKHYNLRVEPEMERYVARQLAAGRALPVIGGESRTGAPVRMMIDPAQLLADGVNLGTTASP